MLKRTTKNFKQNNQNLLNKGLDEEVLFLFTQMVSKELLSDILEYETLISNLIIEDYRFMSYRLSDHKKLLETIESYGDDTTDELVDARPGTYEVFTKEIRKSNIGYVYNILIGMQKRYASTDQNNKKVKEIGKNRKIRVSFEESSFGDMINIIKKLEREKLKKSLSPLLTNWKSYYTHLSNDEVNELDPIDDFLMDVLFFIRDIRNILAHGTMQLIQENFFVRAYDKRGSRKHKINWFLKTFSDQLLLIHDKKFSERILDKVNNNHKIPNEYFDKIFSQEMWKSI